MINSLFRSALLEANEDLAFGILKSVNGDTMCEYIVIYDRQLLCDSSDIIIALSILL